jgi:hypothetical protein
MVAFCTYGLNKSYEYTQKKWDVNQKNHPHQERQQHNTPPIHEFEGQRKSNSQKQSMSNMMNESDEQNTGKAHGQKDERGVQEDERKP